MSFETALRKMGNYITLVRRSGETEQRTQVLASVQDRKAYFNIKTDVEEGDLIEQSLPNGKTRLLRITHVVHHQPRGMNSGHHIEAEWQLAATS